MGKKLSRESPEEAASSETEYEKLMRYMDQGQLGQNQRACLGAMLGAFIGDSIGSLLEFATGD